MPEIGEKQSADTLAFGLVEKRRSCFKGSLFCRFLGRHASIFTLAGDSQMFMFNWNSLSTPGFLWGALLPWLEAEPWENNSRRRATADDNDNINIWEWERHPGKKVKAVCSQEQLRGAHCGTVKQTNKRGGTDCRPHCRAQHWRLTVCLWSLSKLLCNLKYYLYSSACQAARISAW